MTRELPDDVTPNRWTGWVALLGLGRRAEIAVSMVIVAMLAAVAAAVVIAPRWLTNAEESSLDQAIEQAIAADRRLTIRVIDEFGPGFNDDPIEDQRELVEDIATEISPAALDRYGDPRLMIDSTRFVVDFVDIEAETPPALPTLLTFRIHPELDEHSRLVTGRRAARTDERIDDRRVMEFELAPQSATELGWEVGDLIALNNDPTDLTTRQAAGPLPDAFVGRLVGLRELAPLDDVYWAEDERLHRPTVADTAGSANVFAFGIIWPDQLPTRPFAVQQRSAFFIEQRRDLVAGAVTLDNSADTLAALTALDARFRTQPTLSSPGVLSGLAPVLDEERAQRSAARVTITLAAVGLLGVALTTLAQLLQTAFGRRRGWLTVARARGATRTQVVASSTIELGLISGAAITLGALGARVAMGGSSSQLETSLLIGLWLGSMAAAGAMALAEVARPVTVSGRADAAAAGRWGRIARGVLVVVSVAAVVTFRRRGIAVDAPDLDPLVVALPVLVPISVVALTRWVLPAVLRRVTRRGLALGPGRLLGARRVVAAPDANAGLVAVLVLALTVAGLGLAVNRSLEQGAIDASWVEIGAPYRLDTRDGSVAEAVRALPGTVVAASGSTRVNIDSDGDALAVQFVTADLQPLAEITEGTAADEHVPESVLVPDVSGGVPVVAASRVGNQPVRVGDSFSGIGTRSDVEFVVIATRDEAFGRRNDWLLADREVYEAVAGEAIAFSSLAVDAPSELEPELATIAEAAGADLDVRIERLALQRDDPLSRAVRLGYLLAGLMSVVLALLTLVAGAVVTARERRREVAVLGLLGADRREIGRAVASELVPVTLFGIITGSIVGWLVARLYDGRFDLSSFAGGADVAIRPDVVAAIAVGLIVAASAVVLIRVLVQRIVTAPVNQILRIDGAA